MEKQYILFDPCTAERKKITYKELSGITGRSVPSLRDSKRHGCKLRSLNCYILDLDTPISVYRDLLAKEVIPDEIWRDIPNSRWQVSSYGRYRSGLRCQERIIYRVPYYGTKDTSYMIGVRVNGERQQLKAHEKVVELFIGEIPKGHVVYHKDGNKGNNRVDNLGFIRRRELMIKQATVTKMKPVIQLDELTGEVLAEYKTMTAASQANFTSSAIIRQAIKENRSAIGFIWMTEEMALESGVYDRC